jgi:methylmalonyl-CoA mutase C-terminal domain/subunit
MVRRRIRVLLAKPGLDGHDFGVKYVALGLKDAGMEVIYSGLNVSPEQVAHVAEQEDVDLVGISCLSGAHLTVTSKVITALRERGLADLPVILGGIVPRKDLPALEALGVAAVFGPGSALADIAARVHQLAASRIGVS